MPGSTDRIGATTGAPPKSQASNRAEAEHDHEQPPEKMSTPSSETILALGVAPRAQNQHARRGCS